MSPIKKIRLTDSIIDAIREMIVKDHFSPGDKFYSEKELTEKLQVSRSSVREALRILEVNGHLTVRQGKGTFVADPSSQTLESFASWLRSNEHSIQDHFEVRLIIEPKTAWKAAQKADARTIQEMEQTLADFKRNAQAGDIAAAIQYDREFHRLLAQSTKNATLHFLMKSITSFLPDGWISSLHTPGRIEKTMEEHQRILDAIKQGDTTGAMNAMQDHLENAVADIKTFRG